MKHKIQLCGHEFDTLVIVFEKMILPSLQTAKCMEDKMLAALLLEMYESLKKKDRIFRQDSYTIHISQPAAMAFHIYWNEGPMGNAVSSHLVERLVGDINSQFA